MYRLKPRILNQGTLKFKSVCMLKSFFFYVLDLTPNFIENRTFWILDGSNFHVIILGLCNSFCFKSFNHHQGSEEFATPTYLIYQREREIWKKKKCLKNSTPLKSYYFLPFSYRLYWILVYVYFIIKRWVAMFKLVFCFSLNQTYLITQRPRFS